MSRCPQCHTQFTCTQKGEESAPCWCMSLPALPRESLNGAACLCPACLGRIAQHCATSSRASPDAESSA
ncbi:MAG TPA: cysteine-rich CWC family protein [Oxalicibacterium sp.]|nr:cysteine-rich CWC family protein [Oxalicibacterium sp.]